MTVTTPARFAVGDYVEDKAELETPNAGALYKVIRRGRKYYVLQQVSNLSGHMIGVPVGRYTDGDLIAARPETMAEYGQFLRVEVELVETSFYRHTYTRNQVLALLAEELPNRATEFGQMTLTELVATFQAELTDHGSVAEAVIGDVGGSHDARDDFAVSVL